MTLPPAVKGDCVGKRSITHREVNNGDRQLRDRAARS